MTKNSVLRRVWAPKKPLHEPTSCDMSFSMDTARRRETRFFLARERAKNLMFLLVGLSGHVIAEPVPLDTNKNHYMTFEIPNVSTQTPPEMRSASTVPSQSNIDLTNCVSMVFGRQKKH